MTQSLTSQYTYLCMNICSAWVYFGPGVFNIQGHAKSAMICLLTLCMIFNASVSSLFGLHAKLRLFAFHFFTDIVLKSNNSDTGAYCEILDFHTLSHSVGLHDCLFLSMFLCTSSCSSVECVQSTHRGNESHIYYNKKLICHKSVCFSLIILLFKNRPTSFGTE